jgi:sugar lactone lactonase YvrE
MNNYFIKLQVSLLLLVVLSSLNSFTQGSANTAALENRWQTSEVLTTAESVCFNPELNLLYVSCINGNPAQKDGNGFISVLSLNGEVKNQKWIDGLNAPKGMGIFRSKLYVTDIDRVVEIDIKDSKITSEIKVEGAKFLNDIAVDNEGNLFVSDNITGKIHKVHNGVAGTWIESKELQSPNGLFYENGEILVGTNIGILQIRLTDKHVSNLVSIQGGIDGLKGDGKGNYLISDWNGKIQLVGSKIKPVVLMDTSPDNINAADFEFLPRKNMLFVPTFSNNRVIAYELIYK